MKKLQLSLLLFVIFCHAQARTAEGTTPVSGGSAVHNKNTAPGMLAPKNRGASGVCVTASINSSSVSCNGGANGSATVVPSGGAMPYSYTWSPSGGNTDIASGLSAGDYSVAIEEAGGCITTITVNVAEPTPLSSINSQTNVLCRNANNATAKVVVSGGTPGYTYSWTPSGGTANVETGLSSNFYSVTITDVNNCTLVQTFTITQPSFSVNAIVTQTNNTCGNTNGGATAIASGGTGPYTYTWSPSGGNAAIASPLASGTYTVDIKDVNNCPISKTVTIIQSTQFSIAVNSTSVDCNGASDGSATVTLSGGTPAYTYTWSPSGGNTATALALPAGTYTLSASDAIGCFNFTTVTINQPPALAAGATQTNILCPGATGAASIIVSGGTPGYTYTWSPSGGNSASITTLSGGIFTVVAKDANLCSITRTINIVQTPTLVAAKTQTNVACHGGATGVASVHVTGGAPSYSYTWSPTGGNSFSASALSAGNYTVTIQDNNLCVISSTFAITEPAVLAASATAASVSCNGQATGAATVNVTGGTTAYSYTWSPSGGNTTTATGLVAGNYTVSTKDAGGCTASATVNIAQPAALSPTLTQTNVACNAGTGSASIALSGGIAPYTYSWSPSGGNSAASTTLSAGNYTVTAKDANLCSVTLTLTITQPPVLSNSSTQTNVACHGGTTAVVILVAGGGTPNYTYTWSPTGGNSATATGLAAGNYSVTIKDANLCTLITTLAVSEPPALVASTAANSVACNGQATGSGSVTASGGTPSYSYTWSPSGGNSFSATALTAGTYSVLIKDTKGCSITPTLTILQAPSLTVAVAQTSVTCFGSSNGSATVTASGGISPYTYSWTPSGATTTTQSAMTVGNYTVTVKDANLCVNVHPFAITGPVQYTTSATTTSVLCHAQSTGSAVINVQGNTPAYSYTWAPYGGNGGAATGLVAGIYSVSILDAHNCPTSQTLSIAEPPLLTASIASSPANCNHADGSATITANGGAGGYTYTWSPSTATTAVASNLYIGAFSGTVADINGCQLILTTSVSIITPSVIFASGATSLCPGNSTTISVSGTNTFSWTPAAGLSSSSGTFVTASPTITTVYNVQGFNLYGCSVIRSITITVFPDPTPLLAANNTTICAGSTISLTAHGLPATYTWSPATGLSDAFIYDPTATLQNPVTYTVTAANTDGCVKTATIAIDVLPLPVVTVSTTTSAVCLNDYASLTASGASTYSWNVGSISNPLHVLPASNTAYTVTGIDTNGCSNTASIAISVNPLPTVSISSNTFICAGETLTLTASGANTYSWNTGESGTAVAESPLTNSTYSVTGTDASGCKNTATLNITVYAAPSVSVLGSHTVCKDVELSLRASGGTTYTWSTGDNGPIINYAFTSNTIITVSSGSVICAPGTASFAVTVNAVPALTATPASTLITLGQNTELVAEGGAQFLLWTPAEGLNCNTCPNVIAQPSVSTVYTITATNALGCKTSTTVPVQVELLCGALFAPSAFSPNNDNNNDYWCVYGNCISTIHCEIFNRWGQKVHSITEKEQCWDGMLDGVMQTSGVYIFQAQITLITGESKSLKGNFILAR